jgi:DNA polymerase-3 subunit delta'
MEHEKQWQFLKNKFEAGQLSHAYLFSGQNGIGKKTFAKEFVALINGKSVPGSDLTINKEQYPDLLVVASGNSDSSINNEKDMMEIDVAQIRQVNNFLSYKSYYGGYKTVIIEHADRMNQEAQNSFLKTLEEPKGKTLLILLSSKPSTLLPTMISRCQQITFFPFKKHAPSKQHQQILQELLPILQADLATKFQYTKKITAQEQQVGAILEVLQRHLRSIILAKIGVTNMPIQPPFANYSLSKMKHIIQLIETLHTQITVTNASPKLALEIVLMEI